MFFIFLRIAKLFSLHLAMTMAMFRDVMCVRDDEGDSMAKGVDEKSLALRWSIKGGKTKRRRKQRGKKQKNK